MQHQSILNAKFTRQTGLSMVELLIAMAMGLAITTVVLNIFLNMMTGNRVSTAQQQMNEDAQAAFQILGSQIRMAGFNPLQARISTPEKNQLSVSAIPATEMALGVFGCNTGFSNGAISAGPPATSAAPEIWQLICNASGTQPSIAIHYEADQFSPNVTNAAIAADCRGFTVPERIQALTNSNGSSAGTASYRLVENRYFIANGGLSCTGNGSSGATLPFDTITQPLVPNIESMQIEYGVRAPQPFATVTGNPATWTPSQIAADKANTDAARVTAGYLTADQIGPASGSVNTGVHSGFLTTAATTVQPNIINGSYRWALVNTVRICLVVKSATRTLTEKVTDDTDGTAIHGYYFGCNPTTNTPQKIGEDGFMRKAYTMHFAIRSRINTPL